MNKFISLHNHSDFSLQDGLSQTYQMVDRFKELGQTAGAILDHGSISGCPSFAKACKDEGIKSILGCELYVSEQDSTNHSPENRHLNHLPVLAKNLTGWKALMGLVSESNKKENYYYRPRLDLNKVAKYAGNLICFTGHPGTELANSIFGEWKMAYRARSYEEAKGFVHGDWQQRAMALIGKYQDIFGKENVFIEIQLLDSENLPAVQILAKGFRHLAKKNGLNLISDGDAHYSRQKDAIDQRLILCSSLKTTFAKVQAALDRDEDVGLGGFFKSNNYFIPGYNDLVHLHEPEELSNTLKVAEMCESYDILSAPKMPIYDCQDAKEEMRQKCREGWTKLIANRIPKSQQENYVSRIKTELKVFEDANLAPYFLMIADICRYARDELGCLMGAARGSAGGCLTSMLIGITDKSVDPVKNNLTFERFYNAGRNTSTRVSLPDIDIDAPTWSRDAIIKYIRKKYGEDKVAQIATFGTLQGKGALKEVLRAHDACSFAEMGRICKSIPGRDKISDELQEMEEEDGEATSIRWALENLPEQLKEWCNLNKEGELEGAYARYFQQAMRLEGTRKSQGRHAAGVIISPVPLSEVCPLVRDKKNPDELLVGVDKNDAELLGLLKADILGVRMLDKVMDIEKLLRYGSLETAL